MAHWRHNRAIPRRTRDDRARNPPPRRSAPGAGAGRRVRGAPVPPTAAPVTPTAVATATASPIATAAAIGLRRAVRVPVRGCSEGADLPGHRRDRRRPVRARRPDRAGGARLGGEPVPRGRARPVRRRPARLAVDPGRHGRPHRHGGAGSRRNPSTSRSAAPRATRRPTPGPSTASTRAPGSWRASRWRSPTSRSAAWPWARDGTAYLNCEGEDATTTAGVTSVRAIRPDGSTARRLARRPPGRGNHQRVPAGRRRRHHHRGRAGLADRRDPARWHVRAGLAARDTRRQQRGDRRRRAHPRHRPRLVRGPVRPRDPHHLQRAARATGPRFRAGP